MANSPAQKIIVKLEDLGGKTGSTSFWVPTDTTADPLESAGAIAILGDIEGLSTCLVVGLISETSENVVVGTPTSSPWDDRDKMALEFRDSMGSYRTYRFADPKSTCFISPAYEVITVSGGIANTLASLLVTNMKDRAGGSFTFVRGYRSRSRRLRAGSKRFAA